MIAACRKISFALLAAAAASFCVSAYAQSGGATLQGTVTDSSGAVVPNAHIHILAELTGVSRDVDSNNDGFYSAPNLNAGRFKLTVTAAGFATKVENDVVLTVGSVRESRYSAGRSRRARSPSLLRPPPTRSTPSTPPCRELSTASRPATYP